MAQIGGTIGSGRIEDFATAREAAEEVGVAPSTLKRWLKEKKVPGVVWGTDKRGWYYVKKDSIGRLRQHKNSVHLRSS